MKALDNSQIARQQSLSAVEVTDIYDDVNSTEQLRRCGATISMNNTEKVRLKFTLEPRDAEKFMLNAQIVE